MFEETFNLEFKTIFDQYNVTRSGKAMESIGASMLDKVYFFSVAKPLPILNPPYIVCKEKECVTGCGTIIPSFWTKVVI